jgi:protein-L-isoaspartate(D-aspartate) O-methyltransferase
MIRFPGTAIMMIFLMAACSYSQENMNDSYSRQRQSMVERQIEARGVRDKNVLQAMLDVERHLFVPSSYRSSAYGDHPLPIGDGQTISQPYIVALMTESLGLDGSDKVLEIGTGSGYQAAVLGEICDSVFSIEIFESLFNRSSELLKELGYTNIYLKQGDGYLGWEEYAPFDAIIVTCAPTHIPPALEEQLAEGGRMIIPTGNEYYQELVLIRKSKGKLKREESIPVRFVPMIREDGKTY